MLMIEKNYKFGITLQNLMVILNNLKYAKSFLFVVDKKQKVLVLEPKKEVGESGDQNVGTL
jgi:hypothetical protein